MSNRVGPTTPQREKALSYVRAIESGNKKSVRSTSKQYSDELNKIRKQFVTRSRQFEKASGIADESIAGQYSEAAQTMLHEREYYTAKAIKERVAYRERAAWTSQAYKALELGDVAKYDEYMDKAKNVKVSTRSKSYQEEVKATIVQGYERLGYIPSRKPKEILDRDRLANVQWKYAMKEIAVFTFGEIWQEGDDNETMVYKLKREVSKRTGIENPSVRDIMDYYRDVICEYYDDDDFDFIGGHNTQNEAPDRSYEHDLMFGYGMYLMGM